MLIKCNPLRFARYSLWIFSALLGICNAFANEGVTDKLIRIGGVMDLQGDSKELGQNMKVGIEAAFAGEAIQGRALEFAVENDFYSPEFAQRATQQLIQQGIFVMLGNVGTPTAQAVLPLLAEQQIPAVGFLTGANLLRPGVGNIINFRASYLQEIRTIIDTVLSIGITPTQICAFVQNDGFGMEGITALRTAFEAKTELKEIVKRLEDILAQPGTAESPPERNGIGPVGVYTRNAINIRDGYQSLKKWEENQQTPCRFVLTVGTYQPIATFIAYARYKKEPWFFSAVSFTGADQLRQMLREKQITDGVVMTQVVPILDSPLPIVEEARDRLREQLNYVSLEGYIVGKMLIAIMKDMRGPITRANFLKTAQGKVFELGGLTLDFSNDNQGSDLVTLTYLQPEGYITVAPRHLEKFFKQAAKQ